MNQVVLIASFLVPVILAAVIYQNSKENTSRKVLGLSMLNAAFVFVANYFYFLEAFHIYIYLHSIHVALVLFIYPSIYIYVIYLTQQKIDFKRTILHFLPGMVFLLLYVCFFDFLFDAETKINFLSSYRSSVSPISKEFTLVNWIRILNVVIIVLQVVFYCVAILKATKEYTIRIQTELSNAEEYRINWLNKFNFALIIVAVCSVVFYTIDPFSQENNQFLIISMFLMSVFIWLMGIWGNAQKYVELPKPENKVIFENVIREEQQQIVQALDQLMLSKKMFRQKDLKLEFIARELVTNRTYLSKSINSFKGVNFNNYVNAFRIVEAQSILKENKKISMEEVAILSGFGSVISFRRAFIRETSTSPEKWLKTNN